MCIICLSLDKDWITIEEARDHFDNMSENLPSVDLGDHESDLRAKLGIPEKSSIYCPDFKMLDDDPDDNMSWLDMFDD